MNLEHLVPFVFEMPYTEVVSAGSDDLVVTLAALFSTVFFAAFLALFLRLDIDLNKF